MHSLLAQIPEYRRPWKLATLAIGLGLLIAGAFIYDAPDWDIPISFIMAGFTYLTASWSMHVMVERRWRDWPLMLFLTWWCIDGCYALYPHQSAQARDSAIPPQPDHSAAAG